MKQLCYLSALVVLSLFVFACSQDQETSEENLNLSIITDVAAIDQLPNKAFDESKFGMYHGVVASGTSLSRGKIWINVNNNGAYNATIAMVGGEIISFGLKPQLQAIAVATTVYEFESSIGHFVLDIGDFNSPILTNVELYNESHFGTVIKSRSNSLANAVTATFSESENPSFSGTWNLISDGSIQNPNGDGGEAITSLMITYDGNVYTDLIFESFNADACLGLPVYIPTIGSNGLEDYVICDYQNTEFGAGIAKWNLGYDASTDTYMSWMLCETVTSGDFVWISSDATMTRVGGIYLD
jgi:hypothetical protein